MKNLKIVSFNIGSKYIPIKDNRKKQIITDFINEEDYDIVMLQGDNVSSNINTKSLDYNSTKFNNRVVTLYKDGLPLLGELTYGGVCNVSLTNYARTFLACININLKNNNEVREMIEVCNKYGNYDSEYFVRNRVVAGKFPSGFNLQGFCNEMDLVDISSLIGKSYYDKNDKEMLNHILISKSLESEDVHKCIGIVDIAKVGEDYPIEASLTYKKIR